MGPSNRMSIQPRSAYLCYRVMRLSSALCTIFFSFSYLTSTMFNNQQHVLPCGIGIVTDSHRGQYVQNNDSYPYLAFLLSPSSMAVSKTKYRNGVRFPSLYFPPFHFHSGPFRDWSGFKKAVTRSAELSVFKVYGNGKPSASS